MSLGLVGRKVGMTRVFTDDGSAVPVTVLDVANNRVTQIKTPDADGYAAVQVTYGKRRPGRVNKAQAGHLAKAGVEANCSRSSRLRPRTWPSSRWARRSASIPSQWASLSMCRVPPRVAASPG